MRTIFTTSLTALMIGLFTASLSAAPAGTAVKQNATPLFQLAQYGGGGGGGGGYDHHYCRPYWHWACHYGHCRCYHD